jgi:hypothetical protein
MEINKTISLLLLILTFFGCQIKNSEINSKEEIWNKLSIGFNNSEIILSKNDSIAILKTYSNPKETIENSITKTIYTEIKEQKITISSKEKDSIYKWTKKLIKEPVKPELFCTDYAGKLFLDLEINKQVTQSCRYNSICDWSSISYETLKLKKLFKDIFKLE